MVIWFRRRREPSPEEVVLAALYYIERHHDYAVATQLHKLITIAQEDAGVDTFEIVPGPFGPFVKGLNETLTRLEEQGLVSIRIVPRKSRHGHDYMKQIRLTEDGRKEAEKAIQRLLGAGYGWLLGALEAWSKASYKALIYYIYKAYPKYITASRIAKDVKEHRY